MAMPDNTASDPAVIADYISPYDRYAGLLEDWEQGGVALNDGTQGVEVQMWFLSYDDDEDSITYGDFTVKAEDSGESTVVLNAPHVIRCGLAFNRNMDVFIAYETKDCGAQFYWWDPNLAAYTTTLLPAGSRYVACCLDDHRAAQSGSSDVILGYIRNGELYYRQQRDRFLTERSLGSVGAGILETVGMTKNLRLKYEVTKGSGVRLSKIVGQLCGLVNVGADQIDVSALYPIIVRGYKSAGLYTAADTIRALQRMYLFDMPEIDGKLVAVLRGGEIVATISQSDCVQDREIDFETAREQGVEFPLKMHLALEMAETDYTATKVTSERRSRDVKAQSEITLDTALNFVKEDAAQIVDKLHKIAWNEFEGKAEFSIPDSFARLVPSCPISLEVHPGVYRRMRIVSMVIVDGIYECEAVIDRQSAYGSTVTATPSLPPETPPPTIPGPTTWEFIDAPALVTANDDLHFYVAGRGEPNAAWSGFQLQREVGADWEKMADVHFDQIIGEVEETLPSAPAAFIDVTHTVLLSLNRNPSSTSTDLMLSGKGAWVIGDEVIQIRDWVAEGDNWRGSYLFRGRLDTVPATHAIGTRAVFLGNPSKVQIDASLLDTTLTLRAVSFGEQGSSATEFDYVFSGQSQKEWAPDMLAAAQAGNDWQLSWVPRYRLGNSANPIPSSNFYGWQISFTVSATTVVKTINSITPSYTYTEVDQIADFGSAQSSFDTVEVRGLNYLGGPGKALSEAVS